MTEPTERQISIPVVSYEQQGRFHYTVHLQPNTLFDTTELGPGQVYFSRLVNSVRMTFFYHLSSGQPLGEAKVNYQISATFGTQELWERRFTLVPPTMASSDFNVSFALPLEQMSELMDSIRQETGAGIDLSQLTVKALVQPQVQTPYGPITEPFEHTLDFSFQGSTLSVGEELEKSQSGTISETTLLPVVGLHGKRNAAGVGILASLFLLAGLTWMYARSRLHVPGTDEVRELQRARSKHKGLLVQAQALPPVRKDQTVIHLSSLPDLLNLAEEMYRPVIYCPNGHGYIYCVMDGRVPCAMNTAEQNRLRSWRARGPMGSDVTTDESVSRSGWHRIAIYLLLLIGTGGIVGLATYLVITDAYAFGPVSLAVGIPAAPIKGAVPDPRSEYAGHIAFRCDLAAGNGWCMADPQSGDVAPLSASSVYEECQAREPFSPDGQRAAFSRQLGGEYDIFVRDVRGGWVDQLVANSGSNHQPAWSAGGNLLAYVSQDAAGSSIWIYDLIQGTNRRLTHTPGQYDKHPSWSPDGRQITFWSGRGGEMQLQIVEVEGGDARQLGPEGVKAWDPVWIKPRRNGDAGTVSASSPDALGLGLAFEDIRCWAEVSVGDSSGGAPLTRVILRSNDEVVHDSGLMQTSLYRAMVDLSQELGRRQLLLQAWNVGAFAQAPKELRREVVSAAPPPTATPQPTPGPSPTPTLTPIVVTPVPTPADVLAAATRVAEMSDQVARFGPPTATPPNLITATPAPKPFVILNTPTPQNQATAVHQTVLGTAMAATTGTPTPLPYDAVTATPTHTPIPAPRPTSTPKPTRTQRPTRTSTPTLTPAPTHTPTPTLTPLFVRRDDSELLALYVTLRGPTPTLTPYPDVPHQLVGKIAFHSDRLGGDHILVMDDDGSNLALLTDRWVYDVASDREALSPNGQYLVYQGRGRHGLDLFLDDLQYEVATQLTYVGQGLAYDPAWSPDNDHIAFASNQEGDDEIFVVTTDGSVRQLTHNQWEWDKHPSYSPDGRRIAYRSNAGAGYRQIWVMNADGSGKQNISNSTHDDWDPVWIWSGLAAASTSPPPSTGGIVPSANPTTTVPQAEVTITGVGRRSIQTGLKQDHIEIYGSGFQQGVRVLLKQEGRWDILASEVSVVDESLLRCSFDLRELQVRYTEEWTLRVENPDGQPAQTWLWITTASGSQSSSQPNH